jgi:Tol biopolymer transport system component
MVPVFSPDGRSLAYARILRRGLHRYQWGSTYHYESTAVWIIDLETGERRQLTKWRNGLEQFPSSFSPDGTTLLVMRSDVERSQDLETVALRFDGRTSSLLISEGWFPVYSPNGSKIALFRQSGRNEDPPTDLFIIDADGSHLRQLTRTPRSFELLASWDPSGERIAYSKFQGYAFDSGSQGSIMEINSDGTCPTKVLSKQGASFVGPAWQPGPGREAGRIDC